LQCHIFAIQAFTHTNRRCRAVGDLDRETVGSAVGVD
jgi:hypothetical protein